MPSVKAIKVILSILLLFSCSNIDLIAEEKNFISCLVPTLNTNPIQELSFKIKDVNIPDINDYSKIFQNKWVFLEISFIIAKNLKNAISKHTVISDINNHLRKHSNQTSNISKILLNGLDFKEIEEIRDNEEIIGFSLPVIKHGEVLCRIEYSIKGDKLNDTVLSLSDGTQIYVRCVENSEIFWRGIPRKEIKTILYPSFGQDTRFLRDILWEFPYVEEVHLVDDSSQLGYSPEVIIDRLHTQFLGGEFFPLAKFICVEHYFNDREKKDILVMVLEHKETYTKIKIFLHKYNFFHMDKINGLEHGADLCLNKMPGFAGEHTTKHNVNWFKQIYKFTKQGKYVYATHSVLPIDPVIRKNLKQIRCGDEVLSHEYIGEDKKEVPGIMFAQDVSQNNFVTYKKEDKKNKETEKPVQTKGSVKKEDSVAFQKTSGTKKIAITGISGELGRSFSRLLFERGHILTALIRDNSQYKLRDIFNDDEIEKVKIEQGDLFSIDKLKTMILENNVFYHFAGIVGREVDKPDEEILATNSFLIGIIDKLMKESKREDRVRFIHASTYVVENISNREDVKLWIENAVNEFDKFIKDKKIEGNIRDELVAFSSKFLKKFQIPKGINTYTISKLLGETFAFRMKNSVNCRLGNVYGPGCDRHNRVHKMILNRSRGGKNKIPVESRDYIYIGDVAKVLALLADELNPPVGFNLVTGKLVPLEEVISEFKRLTPLDEGNFISTGPRKEAPLLNNEFAKQLLGRDFVHFSDGLLSTLNFYKNEYELQRKQEGAKGASRNHKGKIEYTGDIDREVEERFPSSMKSVFKVPQGPDERKLHTEGPELKHHLQAMWNALEDIDSYSDVLPEDYISLMKKEKDFFKDFILNHDIGKSRVAPGKGKESINAASVSSSGVFYYPRHEKESIKILEEKNITFRSNNFELLKKIIRLHVFIKDLYEINGEKQICDYLFNKGITREEYKILICAIFLDLAGRWRACDKEWFQKDMERIKKIVTIEKGQRKREELEKRFSVMFADTIKKIKARITERDKTNQNFMVFLGTDWIEGYDHGMTQYMAINPLISAVRNYCSKNGIEFFTAKDDDLFDLVRWERKNEKILVLAKEDTIKNAPVHLRKDKNAYLAGVRNIITNPESYNRLIEMLNLLALLALDPEYVPYESNVFLDLSIDYKETGYYIFIHKAVPMDFEEFQPIYYAQKCA
ncbi:MAG: NAD(P)-dependent oxidoreductase [Candidatus Omnitrophota bacterium]